MKPSGLPGDDGLREQGRLSHPATDKRRLPRLLCVIQDNVTPSSYLDGILAVIVSERYFAGQQPHGLDLTCNTLLWSGTKLQHKPSHHPTGEEVASKIASEGSKVHILSLWWGREDEAHKSTPKESTTKSIPWALEATSLYARSPFTCEWGHCTQVPMVAAQPLPAKKRAVPVALLCPNSRVPSSDLTLLTPARL